MPSRPDIAAEVPEASRGVRQVEVPAAARGRSTLGQIDYEDAFLVDTGAADDRTAEEWARAMLEDAPAVVRKTLVTGWSSLGLQIGSARSERLVLGWEIRRNAPDHVLLGARSRVGLPAELLFERGDRTLLFATFVRQENAAARAAWAGVIPLHHQVVRRLLEAGRSRTARHPGGCHTKGDA
jgi:hypothetical protein